MTTTEKVEFWQQQINDWEATCLSGHAYCKQQSLIYHQFVYWRQKLTTVEDYPKQAPAVTGVLPLCVSVVVQLAILSGFNQSGAAWEQSCHVIPKNVKRPF
jgi:hypothetical protein